MCIRDRFPCPSCGTSFPSPMKMRTHAKTCQPPSPSSDKHCACCRPEEGKLSRCSRCRTVWYCSRDCQSKHWKQHKDRCVQVQREEQFGFKKWEVVQSGSVPLRAEPSTQGEVVGERHTGEVVCCLLYTSDAADDLLCVDLGGRRFIKKKQ
eukprot:TRINITY_DN14716_c0_g1_i1.p1 TRINITY_DN14716_c0_g1~~TRINITY_DN14716_c0_g1_i1.p1  ORF type:complete len:151 (-),score=46.75 TRINITY_DN14716_c0_g1_i1:72-524(-)